MCQVKRRSFLGLSATIVGSGLIARKVGHGGLQNESQDGLDSVHHHVHTVSVMTETANRFLAALSPEQRVKATLQFGDDERMNWHFIPKERKGLTLGEMNPYQKHLASALLAAGLSQTGYIKAVTIFGSNPAEARQGARKGLRTLAREDEPGLRGDSFPE